MSHSDRTLNERMTLSRDGGWENSVGITIEFTFPSDLTAFKVQLPTSVDIAETERFQVRESELTWDKQTAVQSMRGRYDPSLTTMDGVQAIDTGEWALVTRPAGGLGANWTYSGAKIPYESTYAVEGPGVISSDGAIAYLGPHEQYTRSGYSERLKVVVPDSAELTHDTDEILDCMEAASRTLDIGPRNDEVLMIAAPSSESSWGPTGTQFGDEGFWALDRTKVTHPNNTCVHEYVHTRQNFDGDESLQWFIEGTANYFAAWAGVKQGLIDFEWFHSHLTGTTDPDTILSDPDTWASYQTKYTKGAVVTMALAAEILERSNGQVGLMDLVRETCEIEPDGPLSVHSWQTCFEENNIPDLSAWLDRYVNGTAIPEPPKDPDAYAFETGNQDDDTTDSSDETSDEEEGKGTDSGRDDELGGTDSDGEKTQEDDEQGGDPPSTPEQPEVSDTKCPICGAAVDDDEEFCGSCGTEMQRECFVCGGQAPGQEFCPICGTELVTACTVCGHKQSSERTYCEKCGTET